MWKVKRMNTARIVVLTIAVGAGGIAAYLASGSDKPLPAAPVVQLPTVDVLVAKSDIGLGQSVTPEDLLWQTWPAATASNNFIRRSERPEATNEVAGSIARSPFIAGEPIREPKLVKATGSGFMAAMLPTGMRAISTEISPVFPSARKPANRVQPKPSTRKSSWQTFASSRSIRPRRKKTARTPWSAGP